MEKEFVPYELAVNLKELGFKDKCLGSYDLNKDFYIGGSDYKINIWINAPLWQQAFDWFTDNYNLLSYPVKYNGYYYCIDEIKDSYAESIYLECTEIFKTRQEARQACLEKLIELISK